MCKTKPCNTNTQFDATITCNNSPTLVTPSRNLLEVITDNHDVINLTNEMIESDVVDLVCFEDVLDDEEEEIPTPEIIDSAVDIAISELSSVRAEVERVYRSLRRMRGMAIGSQRSETSPRKSKKRELAGLMDGLASMECAKRRRW